MDLNKRISELNSEFLRTWSAGDRFDPVHWVAERIAREVAEDCMRIYHQKPYTFDAVDAIREKYCGTS